jgi:hypothetical protein
MGLMAILFAAQGVQRLWPELQRRPQILWPAKTQTSMWMLRASGSCSARPLGLLGSENERKSFARGTAACLSFYSHDDGCEYFTLSFAERMQQNLQRHSCML